MPMSNERDSIAYNALWALENVLGPRVHARLFGDRKEKIVARIRASFAGHANEGFRPIDTMHTLDLDAFERDYYRKGRPVVFKGGARHWPCVEEWSPEYFSARYGDHPVSVGDDKYTDRGGLVETMPLRDAIRLMRSSSIRYVRFSSFFTENPELLDKLDPEFRQRLRKFMLTKGATQLFMGGEGTRTELHAAMTNNMFIQLWGEKDWLLFHPDMSPLLKPICESSPTFRSALVREDLSELSGLTTRLEAGDILYLPPFYWHYVSNPSFSIGMAYRWLALLPSFRTSPTMALLTAVATNPSPFLFLFDIKQGNSAPLFFRDQPSRGATRKAGRSA